ncbi:hypothetical protein RHI14_09035 [Thermosynechococcus sp. WL15]|nr:hypothetical protein RHH81_09055 [Thermosynechococcus sp. PKX95]WNC34310.1 hypothetical protein RHH79_09050 [Thermosynechococcus sp. PKX91]WNC36831.1 hypothetical protein RHI11_09045 [Thermosynechococcus sp. WL11]WNC39352.1 hypothetical protein RHI18_09045 [Thermosynechococcus sp. WL17]WNC41873.1 hypothetical protein RHI14_09035 [Thermosynechococcus sp. WL15]WNC52008.1 hypothetical protein RHJ02_09115 [Thermosynechococcus sp. TG215]WNC57092.1 hypothetical protein RHJ13_09140 [Thermosynecho
MGAIAIVAPVAEGLYLGILLIDDIQQHPPQIITVGNRLIRWRRFLKEGTKFTST